jgi:hypothetical protein
MAAFLKRRVGPIIAAWRTALQLTPTGTYTPSITLTTNLDSATGYSTGYTRISNRVILSGYLDADATAGGSATTELRINKPITSDLTAIRCGGTAIASSGTPVFILADAGTDLIRFVWASPTTASLGITFIIQYEVV